MTNFFLDLLFPRRCVSCQKFGDYICQVCVKKIKFLKNQFCPVCVRSSISGATHPKCATHYSIDGLISLAEFSGPARAAIIKLKYKLVSDLAAKLVNLTVDNLWRQSYLPEVKFILVPVPLHCQRENWRGFNQAAEIGKKLAEKLNLEYGEDYLIRVKNTKPQVDLDAKLRKKNVVGAFKVVNRRRVKNKNFLIVDDMVTTGATIKNCASCLKRAGARQVWGLTFARTAPSQLS